MGICPADNPCQFDNPSDPDVAGVGVVLSFALTALINFIVICAVYFRGFLSQDRYRAVDISFLTSFSPRFNPRSRSHDEDDSLAPYESFLLSLSDQQLITGLAILIALYAKTCSISVFSFQVAVSLAYFSCCIHISTLTVLREYFAKKENRLLRNIRIAIMILLATILVISLFLSQSGTFHQRPNWQFSCAFTEFSFYISDGQKWLQVGNTAMVVWTIASAYGAAFSEIIDKRFKTVIGNWYFWFVLSVAQDRAEKNRLAEAILQKRDGVRSYLDDEYEKHGSRISFRMLLILAPYILEEFARSFLYKIIWILFYFTLGISNFIMLWIQQGYYKQGLYVWGFGQIVPMFLLILPLLSYLEMRKDKKAHRAQKRTTSPDEENAHATTVDEMTKKPGTQGQLQRVTTRDVLPTPSTEKKAQEYPIPVSGVSGNVVYEFLEQKGKKYRRAMLVLVWVMLLIHLGALQFYAVLLGGVFNVVRIAESHFILWTVVLSIGYGLVVGHVLLHVFRGLVFRFAGDMTIWPFWPLAKMQSRPGQQAARNGSTNRSGR